MNNVKEKYKELATVFVENSSKDILIDHFTELRDLIFELETKNKQMLKFLTELTNNDLCTRYKWLKQEIEEIINS